MKKLATVAGTVSLALLTGCSEPADEPIVIGATMSETGAYSTQGRAARNGYQLCVDEVNEAGGVLGRPVALRLYDDESDTERAAALYEQLIVQEQVDVVLGPYGSTLTEAVAPVTERHRMVQITPLAATTSIWEQGRKYLFMVLPPAEQFLTGLLDLAAEYEYSQVASLHEEQLFPAAVADGVAEHAAQLGMELVWQDSYASGTADFAALAAELAETSPAVLAMAASDLTDFIRLTRELAEQEVHLPMFGTSGAVPDFQQSLGSAAEYVLGLSAWEPGLPTPGNEAFVQSYQATFEQAPSFHAAGGYGSCELLMTALEEAGTVNQDALREVLLDLETTTVFGDYRVDDRGYQVANQGVLIQWLEGDKAVVWPPEVATREPVIPAPDWSERTSDTSD